MASPHNATISPNYNYKIVENEQKSSNTNFNRVNKKYLVVADAPGTLFYCRLDSIHLNVEDTHLCKNLPMFDQKLSTPQIQVISGDQISMELYSEKKLIKIVQIYKLGEMTSLSTPYTEIPCKNDSQLVYFRLQSEQPVIMTFSTSLNITFV